MFVFVTLLLLMGKFIFPRINVILEERKKVILADLNEAEAKNNEATKTLDSSAEQLKNAQTRALEITDSALKKSKDEYDKLITDGEIKTMKMMAARRLEIAQEQLLMKANLEAAYSNNVYQAVREITKKELNEADHINLIEKFKGQ